ncbi:MAG: hypothetical protein OXC08_10385, partial [Thiotrichales bacterium]|nr:hypothetical protein [Thiotrichales bacterium]
MPTDASARSLKARQRGPRRPQAIVMPDADTAREEPRHARADGRTGAAMSAARTKPHQRALMATDSEWARI